MSNVNFEIKQFLWYFNESEHADKIWGFVVVEGKLFNFWGRRADLDGRKKLSFKRWPGAYAESDVRVVARGKVRKGYRNIDSTHSEDGEYPEIEKIYTNFVKSFKNQLTLARLSGTVKGEEV